MIVMSVMIVLSIYQNFYVASLCVLLVGIASPDED